MKPNRFGVPVLLALVILLRTTSPLSAQLPTATLLGTVTDSTGGALPGATVTTRNVDTGTTRETVTVAGGSYRLPALPVGNYELVIELVGFGVERRSGLRLSVGQEVTINAVLGLEGLEETVTVSGATPLVETTRSALGTLVSGEQIATLPLNGRNYIDLTMLQPGVSQSRNTGDSMQYSGTWFSSSGAPPRSNSYMLDGAVLTNVGGVSAASITGQTLGLDGIEEYRILTNAFPAEYGGTMGSQMVMVSKSGTNRFRGSAFEFHRNRALDARNFFDDPSERPEFVRNNFGGSLGGPIRQNRIHFHGTVEVVKERRGQTVVSRTLPLAARVDGGLVPQIHPAVRPLLALYPEPNAANDEYRFVLTEPASDVYTQGRVDANFSTNSSAFVRYTRSVGEKTQADTFPQFGIRGKTQSHFLTVSQDHIFSPTVVNTLRFSYSRPQMSIAANYPDAITGQAFQWLPGEPMGRLSVGGIAGIGPGSTYPRAFGQDLHTVSSDMHVAQGRSAWKLGAVANRYRQLVQQSFERGGSVSFPNVNALLLGRPSQVSKPTLGSFNEKTFAFHTFGLYAQNDLRLASDLTLNLGLRYEFHTEYSEVDDRSSAIRDILTDTEATLGRPFVNPSMRNFSPRMGVAWNVRGDGKTAIKAGAARLYDLANLGTALVQTVSGTPPFAAFSRVINPPTFGVPLVIADEAFGRSVRIIDYNLDQPRMWHYNVSVEQEVLRDLAVTVAYAGSQGSNLIRTTEGNPRTPQVLADGRMFWTGSERRLNPAWDTMELKVADASSEYNSLQLSVRKRLGRGLQFQNSFTWSKAVDNGTALASVDVNGTSHAASQNPFDPSAETGPSAYDVRYNWRFNWAYRLPDGFMPASVAGALLNGWQLSGIATVTSGQPFTPALGTNRSRSGTLGGPSGLERPDLVPGVNIGDITRGVSRGCGAIPAGTPVGTAELWFDPCAFTIPQAGTLGNVGRNTLRLPGYSSLDLSLAKTMAMPGSRLELRVETFNVLNTINLGLPARVVYAARADAEAPLPDAGRIATAGPGRQFQLSLRLAF